MTTQNTPLPVGLTYLHTEVGHIDHPFCASAPSGMFYLFLFTPGHWGVTSSGTPELKLDTSELCLILKKKDRAGVLHEIHRWRAADSAAWQLTHGADPTKAQGKYGPCGLTIDGADVVIAFNIRVNGCQTPIEWRLVGAAR
jgi:hypothetical protein